MAALQPTSSQRQTRSSRTQTPSTYIPVQKKAAPSTMQTPATQSITHQSHTLPAPVPNVSTSSRMWTVPLTGTIIACVALVVTLILGIGAWIGQVYGNTYARKSYEITLWGLCSDHPAIQENEVCHESLRDGLHRSVRRDLGFTMQLSALSQVNNFRSHLVSWGISSLATGNWNVFCMYLTLLSRSIDFGKSYNAMGQRWEQRHSKAACTMVFTTITASIAHTYFLFSRGFLDAGFFSAMRISSITIALFVFSSVLAWISPDESVITFFPFLSATNWLLIHEFLTQANNNGIEVPLISEFLYFNLCLAASICMGRLRNLGIGPWISKRTD